MKILLTTAFSWAEAAIEKVSGEKGCEWERLEIIVQDSPRKPPDCKAQKCSGVRGHIIEFGWKFEVPSNVYRAQDFSEKWAR